jgi:dihydropteroate synthase/2-amino-4-hydroxy-6-hydroxymethyldihydropteridine diphosphokinase
VGSNLGDRYQNIASALEMLCDPEWQPEEGVFETVHLVKTSYLHETAPMYMVNQPAFLNGAVQIATDLSPRALLRRIKRVETKLGRDLKAVRNGPRPVDLDIIMYEERNDALNLVPLVLDTPELTIPHAGMSEREFVLKPLCELLSPDAVHPVLSTTIHDLLDRIKRQEYEIRDKDTNDKSASVRVLPLPRGRWLHFNETMIMGILNVTPDSFSDGGNLKGSVDMAVKAAMQMVEDGADIIDIGGESTRPGAEEVRVEEEMLRTIPVIREIRTGQVFKDRKVSDIPISIDTRHAEVARAAVEAGADIVNDVSGGTFDSKMLETVAELRVPIVLMHSRGTPETMQGLTEYDSVVGDVARELLERSRCAEYAGIPRWNQVLDPGIGFAKDLKGNLILLRHMSTLRSLLGDAPILLGTSRKRFIATIANHYLHDKSPEKRDYGTVASCIAALCLEGDTSAGCNILRVHNVQGMKQAAMVMDAVKRAK